MPFDPTDSETHEESEELKEARKEAEKCGLTLQEFFGLGIRLPWDNEQELRQLKKEALHLGIGIKHLLSEKIQKANKGERLRPWCIRVERISSFVTDGIASDAEIDHILTCGHCANQFMLIKFLLDQK